VHLKAKKLQRKAADSSGLEVQLTEQLAVEQPFQRSARGRGKLLQAPQESRRLKEQGWPTGSCAGKSCLHEEDFFLSVIRRKRGQT
jgi:hypothetical protein